MNAIHARSQLRYWPTLRGLPNVNRNASARTMPVHRVLADSRWQSEISKAELERKRARQPQGWRRERRNQVDDRSQ
jgi:hypothetical protein